MILLFRFYFFYPIANFPTFILSNTTFSQNLEYNSHVFHPCKAPRHSPQHYAPNFPPRRVILLVLLPFNLKELRPRLFTRHKNLARIRFNFRYKSCVTQFLATISHQSIPLLLFSTPHASTSPSTTCSPHFHLVHPRCTRFRLAVVTRPPALVNLLFNTLITCKFVSVSL